MHNYVKEKNHRVEGLELYRRGTKGFVRGIEDIRAQVESLTSPKKRSHASRYDVNAMVVI